MRLHYTILAALLLLTPLSAKEKTQEKDFTNSVGIVFKHIPTGEFMMGSVTPKCPNDDPFTRQDEYQECIDDSDKSSNSDETPYHKISIKGFQMSSTEVTQLQYYQVMGKNPAQFLTDELGYDSRHNPVENVSWDEAIAFINRLNKLEKTTKYRLPTEAEWEYAARSATATKWSFGNDELLINDHAWYALNSGDQTHPVGKKQPNAWGLYDMHGNVWEWCQDWYVDNYNTTPTDGSANYSGPKKEKVLRGGSWIYFAQDARSAIRSRDFRNSRYVIVGFRVVRGEGDDTTGIEVRSVSEARPHLQKVKKESIDDLFNDVSPG